MSPNDPKHSIKASSLLIIALLFVSQTFALDIPTYSHEDHPLYSKDHPLHNANLFPSGKKPSLPPVARYASVKIWEYKARAFSVSTGKDPTSDVNYLHNVDGLTTENSPKTKKQSSSPLPPYATIQLNRESRVFLLLSRVVGKPDEEIPWTSITVDVNRNFDTASIEWAEQFEFASAQIVNENERNSRQVLLEMKPDANRRKFHVPMPYVFTVNGKQFKSIEKILFTDPTNQMNPDIPRAFEAPELPDEKLIRDFLHKVDGANVNAGFEVNANTECPPWLHDIHVVNSKPQFYEGDPMEFKGVVGKPYWRTWHPSIDPIYWCYHRHEHGSFPGKYLPAYNYTASKTYSYISSTAPKFWEPTKTADCSNHIRQDHLTPQNESHEGFKNYVFKIVDHDGLDHLVVMTVHADLSETGRFATRHHTMIFSVFREKDGKWVRELHFQFKADFGFGTTRTGPNKQQLFSGPCERLVKKSMEEAELPGLRRFQLFINGEGNNYSEMCERKVSRESCKEDEELTGNSSYEEWLTRLPLGNVGGKLEFQFRGPATGMSFDSSTGKFLDDLGQEPKDENETGSASLARVVKIKTKFELTADKLAGFPRGTFYTDTYLNPRSSSDCKDCVQQFIDPEFKSLPFRSGKIIPAVDDEIYMFDAQWDRRMLYKGLISGISGFYNVEGAVDGLKN